MNRKTQILLFLAGASLAPAAALAGLKASPEVTITNLANNTVRLSGSLIGAHNSADSVQFIGCQIKNDFSYCWGTNAAGRYAMCSTADEGAQDAMRTTNGASYMNVYIQAGWCSSLEVMTGSQWMSPVRTSVLEAVP